MYPAETVRLPSTPGAQVTPTERYAGLSRESALNRLVDTPTEGPVTRAVRSARVTADQNATGRNRENQSAASGVTMLFTKVQFIGYEINTFPGALPVGHSAFGMNPITPTTSNTSGTRTTTRTSRCDREPPRCGGPESTRPSAARRARRAGVRREVKAIWDRPGPRPRID